MECTHTSQIPGCMPWLLAGALTPHRIGSSLFQAITGTFPVRRPSDSRLHGSEGRDKQRTNLVILRITRYRVFPRYLTWYEMPVPLKPLRILRLADPG